MASTPTYSDQELIDQIKDNDKAAFRILFDRHYKVMLGTAINLLKNVDAGKDMVQEVFFTIWKKRETLEINTNVAAYLKRAVINRALNQIRSQKPFVEEEQLIDKPSAAADALDDLALQELETALDKALDTLPERCRMVFVMKRLEGMSQKEIGAALNISTKTVENQITKAMKVLKEALQLYRRKKDKGG